MNNLVIPVESLENKKALSVNPEKHFNEYKLVHIGSNNISHIYNKTVQENCTSVFGKTPKTIPNLIFHLIIRRNG